MEHFKSIKAVAPVKSDSKLMGAMQEASSIGSTDNGAKTFIRSGSLLLDFYAQAGAMRGNPNAAVELFKKAFAEDRLNAIKVLFYLRDVRGGQGERDLFRNCIQWLGNTFPEIMAKVVGYVPEYGRWDDLFFNDPTCLAEVKRQFDVDIDSESPSLLAKWLPTANASSPSTRAKAKLMAGKLGYGIKEYRIKVRELRKKLKVVEEKMSAQKWGEIDYSAVPSQASRIYKDAFKKHDEVRYGEFVGKAEKGEVKINASTLYPYQIYKSVETNYSRTLEALWNQLPDYTQGKNALVIADVSGSMSGDPMSVSVSLALYFAERNKGLFKDHFLTFSAEPRLQHIVGSDLQSKMSSIERSAWDMNTNLEAAFNLILDTAITHRISPDEMPQTLYIISDMEFDACVTGTTLHEFLKEEYENAGYKLPTVVFWQVNSHAGKNLPVRHDENGVALVSGFSPVIFKMVVENKNPIEVMMDTINSERYAQITI